ncbi:hypothetical protein KUCAC02_025092, partial [Chaenocephalus aceratus]
SCSTRTMQFPLGDGLHEVIDLPAGGLESNAGRRHVINYSPNPASSEVQAAAGSRSPSCVKQNSSRLVGRRFGAEDQSKRAAVHRTRGGRRSNGQMQAVSRSLVPMSLVVLMGISVSKPTVLLDLPSDWLRHMRKQK